MKPAWLTERHLQLLESAWIVDWVLKRPASCAGSKSLSSPGAVVSQRLNVTPSLLFIFSRAATFRSSWFLLFRRELGYELEKIRSPWLRCSMRSRSLFCDSADERARWFDGRDGNAARPDARFDGTDANATRSHDEFTCGHRTLWQSKLQSR